MKLNLILLLFLVITVTQASELKKVSLQLNWLDQFQFAGYYVAKEKGFYKNVAIDVKIKKFKPNINIIKDIEDLKTTFAVGRTSLLIDKSNDAKIKLLFAAFQSSPFVLIAKKDSNIKTINDFKNKKMMTTRDTAQMVSLYAMMKKYNISKEDVIEKKHSFNVDDLINNKTDLMVAYTSNEPFLLKEKGIETTIFDPKDYGFNFYGDIVFTSNNQVRQNPQMISDFKEASIKGWKYAFSHIDETVDLILEKYNTQHKSKAALEFEANELKKLAFDVNGDFGTIDKPKLQRIYDLYNIMNLVHKSIDLDTFVFDIKKNMKILTRQEEEYLKNKKEIKVCYDKTFVPATYTRNGEFKGISKDVLDLISHQQNIKFKYIKTNNWLEQLEYLKEGKCEITAVTITKPNYYKFLTPTQSYLSDQLVLVTKIGEPYFSSLDDIGKKTIGIKYGFKTLHKYLASKYPNINFIEIKDGEYNSILENKIFGYINISLQANSNITQFYSSQLKIMTNVLPTELEGSFGVRNDEPMLLSILNKILSSIKKSQLQEIIEKYYNIKVENHINWKYIFYISMIFILIIIVGIIILLREKRYRKQLEKQKELYNLVFENSSSGVMLIDFKKGKIIECNQVVVEMLKYNSKNDILNINPSKLSPKLQPDGKDSDKKASKMLRLAVIKGSNSFEWKHIRSNGEEFWSEITLTSITIDNRQIIHIIWKDIEERKRAKQELEELNKTLEDRVRIAVEKTKEQQKQILQQSRLAQMGEMISMIAHQWRQPLSAISAVNTSLVIKVQLGQTPDANTLIKATDKISQYLQHLTTTIDDFRDFFKPAKEKHDVTYDNVLVSTLNIIEVSIKNSNINLIKDYNSDIVFHTYQNDLKQVIINILKNAKDALLEREVKDAYIKIQTIDNILTISDNAGGIKEEIIEKIFDPYFTTKDEKNGTGLGLYMSKMIIEEHCGGTLEVSNTQDGAEFTINLGGGEEIVS